MDLTIQPRKLSGSMCAPFSKSDAHRVLIAAALCNEPTEITLLTEGEDVRATIRCLEALGAKLSALDDSGLHHRMEPLGTQKISPTPTLDCGESGTTLRLLIPVVAALGIEATFTAKGRLPERPLGDLVQALEAHGARFSAPKPPFTLSGKLKPGKYELPGNISSQYVSGLLLALPLLESVSTIALTTPLESVAYVAMTKNTLERFGVSSHEGASQEFCVDAPQSYCSPGKIEVEGDWSNAAFFLSAGALGGPVALSGLTGESLQGDKAIAGLLEGFGACVQREATLNSAKGGLEDAPAVASDTPMQTSLRVTANTLQGQDIDVSEVPDLFPILAVVAATAEGTTRLYNAARLRIKESDRITAVATMLDSIGAEVEELPDALVIRGKSQLDGGTVEGAGDHRIVMAAAIASLVCTAPVTILGAEAVAKSYPHFFEDFGRLGGSACVINDRK